MPSAISLPPILFAPVLRAEGWMSIDLHHENCLEYYARSAPELEVIDLSPDERLASSKLGRKILREIIYPLKIRSRGKRYTRLGPRPILHVIDHSYGHSKGRKLLRRFAASLTHWHFHASTKDSAAPPSRLRPPDWCAFWLIPHVYGRSAAKARSNMSRSTTSSSPRNWRLP